MAERLKWLRAALIGVLAATAAGCAGVPATGAVHSIDEHGNTGAGTGLDRPYVRLLPPKPQQGEAPDDIIDGFRTAMADFTDDHAAARDYLTPVAAQAWDADARTVVYGNIQLDTEASQLTDASGKLSYVFRVSPVAIVDRDHGYRLFADPEQWEATVAQTRPGTWRITSVLPGTVLSEAEFNRAFRGLDVYFPADRGHVLVPDHVFLPTPPNGLLKAMVQQLVSGPTTWLAPSVRAVAPPGSTVHSVSVDPDGTAEVSLGGDFSAMSDDARHDLLAAVTWTLTQPGIDVKAVQVHLDGVASAPVVTRQDFSGYDPDAYPSGSRPSYVNAGHVQQLSAGAQDQQPGPQEQPALDGLSDPVAPLSANGLAAVRHERLGKSAHTDSLVVFDAGQWRPVYTAAHIAPPTWMPDGSAVWTVARAADGHQTIVAIEVLTSFTGTVFRPVTIPIDLTGSGLTKVGTISAIRMSRDGTRLALVRSDDATGKGATGTARPWVGRIEQHDGQPTLGGLRPVAPMCTASTSASQHCLVNALDIAWADADHVVVLGNNAQGDPDARTPYLVAADGSSLQALALPGVPSDIVSITAAPGQPLVAVVPPATKDGKATIYVQSGGTWTTAGSGSGVHYPD